MKLLITDQIVGHSGFQNQFSISPTTDDAGRFSGLEARVHMFGGGSDLSRQNLINVLEKQLQISIARMYSIDEAKDCGYRDILQMMPYTIEAIRTTQVYITMLKDRVNLTFNEH